MGCWCDSWESRCFPQETESSQATAALLHGEPSRSLNLVSSVRTRWTTNRSELDVVLCAGLAGCLWFLVLPADKKRRGWWRSTLKTAACCRSTLIVPANVYEVSCALMGDRRLILFRQLLHRRNVYACVQDILLVHAQDFLPMFAERLRGLCRGTVLPRLCLWLPLRQSWQSRNQGMKKLRCWLTALCKFNGYHLEALIPRTGLTGMYGEAAHATARRPAASSAPSSHGAAQGKQNILASGYASTHRQQSATTSVSARPNNVRVSSRDMEHILQGFVRTRGSSLKITARNAADVQAASHDSKQLGAVLLTELQATVHNSDSQPHAAEKLAAAWRRYMYARSQGPGRKLGRADTDKGELCRAKLQHVALSSPNAGSAPDTSAKLSQSSASTTRANTETAQKWTSTKPADKRKCQAARVQLRQTLCRRVGNSGQGETLADAPAEGRGTKRILEKQSKDREAARHPSQTVKRRRYSCKSSLRPEGRQEAVDATQADPEENLFVLALNTANSTRDPRAAVDTATDRVVMRVAKHVTLPDSAQHCAETEAAYQLPDTHCGFAACNWVGSTEADLAGHVQLVHADGAVQRAPGCLPALCAECRRARYAAVVLNTALQLTRRNVWALQYVPAPAQLPVCNGHYHDIAHILETAFLSFDIALRHKLGLLCFDFWSLLPSTARHNSDPCAKCYKTHVNDECPNWQNMKQGKLRYTCCKHSSVKQKRLRTKRKMHNWKHSLQNHNGLPCMSHRPKSSGPQRFSVGFSGSTSAENSREETHLWGCCQGAHPLAATWIGKRRVARRRRNCGSHRRRTLWQDHGRGSLRCHCAHGQRALRGSKWKRCLLTDSRRDIKQETQIQGGGARHGGAAKQWEELPKPMQEYFRNSNISQQDFKKLQAQDWCRDWEGWADVRGDMGAEAMRDCVNRFLRLNRQNRDTKRRSNEQRLAELARHGWTCHRASGRGNNCLIDSLAIGLAAQGLIPKELVNDSEARMQACSDCRQMLLCAAEENLRPWWLDRRGRIRNLPAGEHANAFLQPDTHSRAIVHFLLEYYDNHAAVEQNEFRVIAYTPNDGMEIDPLDGAVIIRSQAANQREVQRRTLHIFTIIKMQKPTVTILTLS